MFNTIEKQYCNDFCEKNCKSEKNLVISFSLLMRLFEWCKEDAQDDVEMHKMMEKLVAFNDGVNPLKIDVYDCLISDVKEETEEYCSNEELDDAFNLGQEYAENDIELSSDGSDYSLVAGEIITDEKDNGYGASNAELEQFWQGYNATEPTYITLCNDKCIEEKCCDIDDETESQIEYLISLCR